MSKNTNLSFLTDYITADITNGRIGINTPSPTVAFDVTGAAKFSGVATAKSLSVVSTNGYSGQIIQQGDIFGTSATNLLIQSSTSNGIGFLVNGGTTFNMFINSTGNVGIGTTSPDALLTVAGANQATGAAFNTYGNVLIYSTDSYAQNKGGALSLGGKYNSAGTPIATFARIHGKKENATVDSTAGYLSFETVPEATATLTERMRITSTGNVAIGTNAPLDTYIGRTVLTINNNGAFGAFLNFGYNGTLYAAMESNTTELRISNYQNIPTIFYTNTAERMRITSGGNVQIGGTTAGNFALYVKGVSSTNANYALVVNNSTPGDLFFCRNDGLINTGLQSASPYNNADTGRSVIVNSGGTLGYTSSTRESKTNIKQLSDVSWLYQLNPVSFNYRKKDNEMNYTEEFYEEKWYGLIADEVESVNEDLIFYNTKEDTVKQLAGVEYSKIVPALVKAVQELSEEIKILKQK